MISINNGGIRSLIINSIIMAIIDHGILLLDVPIAVQTIYYN